MDISSSSFWFFLALAFGVGLKLGIYLEHWASRKFDYDKEIYDAGYNDGYNDGNRGLPRKWW